MVAHRVIGNDLVVTLSAEGGQLQLNAFEPVIIPLVREQHIPTDEQIAPRLMLTAR